MQNRAMNSLKLLMFIQVHQAKRAKERNSCRSNYYKSNQEDVSRQRTIRDGNVLEGPADDEETMRIEERN
jgi:hypothetical protein